MRTKALALMAAIGLIGSAAGFAQVYSQNAVGYYTLNLDGGKFNLVANQLNNGDNNLNTIMPSTTPLPDGTSLLTWTPGGTQFNPADTFFAGFGWFDDDLNPSATTLAPGQGAFVEMPPGADVSIVLVGDVPQGTGPDALTLDLVPGFQIVSHLTPQEIGVDAAGFPAADGDSIQFFDPQKAGTTKGGYEEALTFFAGFGWVDEFLNIVDPTPAIGQAFFYERAPAGGSATWTREFSVNP
jgi:hypothetical protein